MSVFQVDTFRPILTKPAVLHHISESKVSILLQDLQSYPVGLSANGAFVINFNVATAVWQNTNTYY
jgi:hypothetical protein